MLIAYMHVHHFVKLKFMGKLKVLYKTNSTVVNNIENQTVYLDYDLEGYRFCHEAKPTQLE